MVRVRTLIAKHIASPHPEAHQVAVGATGVGGAGVRGRQEPIGPGAGVHLHIIVYHPATIVCAGPRDRDLATLALGRWQRLRDPGIRGFRIFDKPRVVLKYASVECIGQQVQSQLIGVYIVQEEALPGSIVDERLPLVAHGHVLVLSRGDNGQFVHLSRFGLAVQSRDERGHHEFHMVHPRLSGDCDRELDVVADLGWRNVAGDVVCSHHVKDELGLIAGHFGLDPLNSMSRAVSRHPGVDHL